MIYTFVVFIVLLGLVLGIPDLVFVSIQGENLEEPEIIFDRVQESIGIPLTYLTKVKRSFFTENYEEKGIFEDLQSQYPIKFELVSSVPAHIHRNTTVPHFGQKKTLPNPYLQSITSNSSYTERNIVALMLGEPPNWDEVLDIVRSVVEEAVQEQGCVPFDDGELHVGRENHNSIRIINVIEHCSAAQQSLVMEAIGQISFIYRVRTEPRIHSNLFYLKELLYSYPLGGSTTYPSSKEGKNMSIAISDANFSNLGALRNVASTVKGCNVVSGKSCISDGTYTSHGNHTAGIIGMDTRFYGSYGVSSSDSFSGIAPDADLFLAYIAEPDNIYYSFDDTVSVWANIPNGNNPLIHSVSVGTDPTASKHPFQVGFIPYDWGYKTANDRVDQFFYSKQYYLGVVAAGNIGNVSMGGICSPAFNRNVLSVGATVNANEIEKVCNREITDSEAMESASTFALCNGGSQTNEQKVSSSVFSPFYFSSSGATVDGRLRPHISAPGGPIISMGSGSSAVTASGTSMAAPAVAAGIAAALSDNPTTFNSSTRLRGSTLKAVAIATADANLSQKTTSLINYWYRKPSGSTTNIVTSSKTLLNSNWHAQRGWGVFNYTNYLSALKQNSWIEGVFYPEAAVTSISPSTYLRWYQFNPSSSSIPPSTRLAKYKVTAVGEGAYQMKVVLSYADADAGVGELNTMGYDEVMDGEDSETSTADDLYEPKSPTARVNELDLFVVLDFGDRQIIRTPSPVLKSTLGDSNRLCERMLTENDQVVWLDHTSTTWPDVYVYVALRRIYGTAVDYSISTSSDFSIEAATLDSSDLMPGNQCFGTVVGGRCDCGTNTISNAIEDCSLESHSNPVTFTVHPFGYAYYKVPNGNTIHVSETKAQRSGRHFDTDIPIMPFTQGALRRFGVVVGTVAGVPPDLRSSFVLGSGQYSFYSNRQVNQNLVVNSYDYFNPATTDPEQGGPVTFTEQKAGSLSVTASCGDSTVGSCIAVVFNWDAYHEITFRITGTDLQYLGAELGSSVLEDILNFFMSTQGIIISITVVTFIILVAICCRMKNSRPKAAFPPMPPMMAPPMSMGHASMGPMSMRPQMSMGPQMSMRPQMSMGGYPSMGPQYGRRPSYGGW